MAGGGDRLGTHPAARSSAWPFFKVLGLYSSRKLAEERIERARSLPGFRRSPEGFCVHEYTLGQAHWPDGFRAEERTEG